MAATRKGKSEGVPAPVESEGVPAPVESEIPTAPVESEIPTAPVESEVPTAPVESEIPTAPVESAARCTVAPGRHITCARGILGPGSAISAQDLAGDGAEALAMLLRRGYVVAAT